MRALASGALANRVQDAGRAAGGSLHQCGDGLACADMQLYRVRRCMMARLHTRGCCVLHDRLRQLGPSHKVPLRAGHVAQVRCRAATQLNQQQPLADCSPLSSRMLIHSSMAQVNPVAHPLVLLTSQQQEEERAAAADREASLHARGQPMCCDEWPTQRQQNLLRRSELGDG